ncbi:histidine kinase dimerization/phosphoacceptor domain -containing protein [Azospirillum sp. sgz302134]
MPQVFAAGAGRGSEDDQLRSAGLGAIDGDLLREVVEQSPAPTAVVDAANQACRYANAALRALGIAAGQSLSGLFSAADGTLFAEVARTGQPKRIRVTGPDRQAWDMDVKRLNGASQALLVTLLAAAPDNTESADQQIREVSHRVKNTLQLVSSLMTLQTLSAKDPEMRRAFQEACGRIGTVTQAHQRIHGASRGSLVDFAAYLKDACRELEGNFAAAGANRRIVVSVEEAMLPVDSVIPLALIVNELVGNAIKFAYPSGTPGEIEVGLLPLPEGGRRLTIADHGIGLPPGLDVARADTLGMKVARAFAGQLKGRLRAEPNEPGVRFVIDLPF